MYSIILGDGLILPLGFFFFNHNGGGKQRSILRTNRKESNRFRHALLSGNYSSVAGIIICFKDRGESLENSSLQGEIHSIHFDHNSLA